MVSSRSKTAAEAAANKRTTRAAAASGTGPVVPDISTTLQENVNKKKGAQKKSAAKSTFSKAPVSAASSATKSIGKGKQKAGGTYCLCNGEDDGSPMIKCEGDCQNWYHFRCIELDEDVAGEIEKYYCPDCETKTGFKTVSKLDFEGTGAFTQAPPTAPTTAKKTHSKAPAEDIDVVNDSPEETDGAGSEDDYVEAHPSKKARSGKRTARQLAYTSDKSESDDEDIDSDGGHRRRASKGGRLKRLKKASTSPAPESSTALKRRGSSAQQSSSKRSKTAESAHDDAIRKYCLSKLEEIIRPMFEEYREAETISQAEIQDKGEEGSGRESTVPPPPSEEEKNALEQKVKSFVNELEHCMMETYAEPDKTGKPSAAGKYKERFRMLQFNLPKRDRVALRKGIASGRITPAQLNVMSSTDLADEQTKHEIEMAEKEALEHSILQKITAPRAKITHKGFETIEDVSGQRAVDAAKEEEEQRMEMEKEKREREKLARLRTLSQQRGSPTVPTQQSPLSATFPKASSPTVLSAPGLQHQQPSWGAPPPAPSTAQQSAIPPASPTSTRPSVRPLFMPNVNNDVSSSGQGLSLADIMNIDDEAQDAPPSNPQERMSEQAGAEAGPSTSPVITTPSGPSPFAPSKPASSSQRRPSFDLNTLWTGPGKQDVPDDPPADSTAPEVVGSTRTTEDAGEDQGEAMELDSDEDDDDERALDAILEQRAVSAQEAEATVAKPTSTIDSLPEVWSGQVLMPRETFDALVIDVSCKQVGGRTLEPLSGYWQTLFPSPQARIDGRVPTGQSVRYLVSIRMNSSKELIVVSFIPRSDEARAKYNELIDFLIGKDRHALVFPWGTRPNPQAPGRELYLVPLLKDQPLPEFIELMDDHHLPQERTENILLGAFVLNKGRLTPNTTPMPTPGVPTPATTQPFPPTPIPSMSSTQMPSVQTLPFSSVPPVSQPPTGQPPTTTTPPVPVPAKIDQAVLAAEVASLTPEQISLMLRHLSQNIPLVPGAAGNGGAGGAPTQPVPVPGVPPVSGVPPGVPSTAYPVPGMPGMPPFPPQFPPANHQQQQHVQPQPQPQPQLPSGQFSPPQRQFSPPQQFSPPHLSQSGHYSPAERHFDDRDWDDRHGDFGNGREGGYGGRGGPRGRGNDRGKRGYGHRGRGKPFHDDRGGRPPSADGGWGGRGRGGGPR